MECGTRAAHRICPTERFGKRDEYIYTPHIGALIKVKLNRHLP